MNDEFSKELDWAFAEIQGSSSYSLDRNRPYNGQSHTTQGERGKQMVSGLTMRDISDCIVLSFLTCGDIHRENPIHDDMYTIDLKNIDPGAVIKNASCNIEKMMGIYPNVPPLKYENKPEEKL